MADTEIKQTKESDSSIQINGDICGNQKSIKLIDTNDKNHVSSENSNKVLIESEKKLSNSNNENEICKSIKDLENYENKNISICKSDSMSKEFDNNLNNSSSLENDTLNGIEDLDKNNDHNEQNETNRFTEQTNKDEEQIKEVEDVTDENNVHDQNDTEIKSDRIKKSLEDSSINLDKSVTIVKVADPYHSSDNISKKKVKSLPDITLTPRRSSRNINKSKNYLDKEEEKKEAVIEDSVRVSPLKLPMITSTKPIVVNDTKKLVEIAAGTKPKSNKKEPTLVIIDTNMLSGRSNLPISVSVQSSTQQNTISVSQNNRPMQNTVNRVQQQPQTTIKPFILSTPQTSPVLPISPAVPKTPVILPTLTDDMFVVEAPSFIVPYVYEKPPKNPLKEFVEKIEKELKEKSENNKETNDLNGKNSLSSNDHEPIEKTNDIKDKESINSVESEKMEVDANYGTKKDEKKESISNKHDILEKNFQEKSNESHEKMDIDGSDTVKTNEVSTKNTLSEPVDVKKCDSITDLTIESDEKKLSDSKEKSKNQQSLNYFENPLGKFFMQIGVNLVQEHVQLDLLRTQRRKRDREGDTCPEEVHIAISSLIKTLEFSKENNDPFQFNMKKCELCNFKSESSLVMAHHLETPHMTANYCYRCNFCTFQVRNPHEILQHMDSHNIRGRLERGPALHQCPSCPFEDSYKGKLTRHLISCTKKYRPEINQSPPLDWEPPAKIPRVLRNKPSMSPGNAVYQAAMSGFKQFPNPNMLQLQQQQYNKMVLASGVRARSRAVLPGQRFPGMVSSFPTPALPNPSPGGILLRNTSIKPINQPMIVPTPYSLNNHTYQTNSSTNKSVQQPSISITPLPRSFPSNNTQITSSSISKVRSQQSNQSSSVNSGNKPTFVICEICDGYIKDLEQLRNHMQWIHKVKIHPKMIYNRPPLNCQKCQFRFFTDQGLERHLLGSHGLVTSSMQEAANKGKDGGRCPVCGRVYQWKLLNHVSRDHSMSLKPAHLSYKCTVCTATFGMYKQFENHVYSAHSNVAKNSSKKSLTNQTATSASSSSLVSSTPKPLKINDEITIIPQPPKAQNLSVKNNNSKPVTIVSKQSATPSATAKTKV
ncbi:MOG interacting and ectopic P-granules protein 1 isoform X2 [Daktulosphaira vitifoliae]|nr:MOG interacting and ectopic P-granules protein 1 isoform X2 [Daktulosphaira vitifoliae]